MLQPFLQEIRSTRPASRPRCARLRASSQLQGGSAPARIALPPPPLFCFLIVSSCNAAKSELRRKIFLCKKMLTRFLEVERLFCRGFVLIFLLGGAAGCSG